MTDGKNLDSDDMFELWWADHMPKATRNEAWAAWVAVHKAGAALDQAEPVAWPKDAAEVRAFFRSDFLNMKFANADHSPSDNDQYLISAHDFLSAINWWADHPNLTFQAQPHPIEPSIEEAARVMAEAMEYPWAYMPEYGRQNMREIAKKVCAALAKPKEAQ